MIFLTQISLITRSIHRYRLYVPSGRKGCKLHSLVPINRQSSQPTLIRVGGKSRQARAKRRAILLD